MEIGPGSTSRFKVRSSKPKRSHVWNQTISFYSYLGPPCVSVKFNIMNLNRQAKLYSQGMKPLYKITPYQDHWERIKDKPVCSVTTLIYLSQRLLVSLSHI